MRKSFLSRVKRTLAVVSGVLGLIVALPVAVSAGGNAGNPAIGLSPTFQEQTSGWSSHQWALYNRKLSHIRAIQGKGSNAVPLNPPGSKTLDMGPWGLQHESPDYMCGPATISEMYSHWYINVSQAQAASDMGTTSAGTDRGPMQPEANRYQGINPYVWTNVGPGGGGTENQSGPSDLKWYTADDIGTWSTAVAYDIETYGSHGHVLPKYPNVDWKHYFPGVAYTGLGYNIAVNDPHFPSQDWYSNLTLWRATDNFTGPNGSFVPNQVLY